MTEETRAEKFLELFNKGKEFTLPKASIEKQQKTGLSLMPANVHEIVTPQEFYDLVGYLAAKRAKKE